VALVIQIIIAVEDVVTEIGGEGTLDRLQEKEIDGILAQGRDREIAIADETEVNGLIETGDQGCPSLPDR